MRREKVYNVIIRYTVLFLFWQLLCGDWNFYNLVAGLVVSGIVTWLSVKLFGFTKSRFLYRPNKLLLIIKFCIKLLVEIVKSNISMAKLLLNPQLPISPGVIRYKTGLSSNLTKVMLANAITLTPGTLTVEIKQDEFVVHMLVEDSIKDILENDLESILLEAEDDINGNNL